MAEDKYFDMMMIRRRAGILPDTYKRVNYLANPNKAYINTSFSHRSGAYYEVDVYNNTQTTNARILGFGHAGSSGNRFSLEFPKSSSSNNWNNVILNFNNLNIGTAQLRAQGIKRTVLGVYASNGRQLVYANGALVIGGTDTYNYNHTVYLFCTHPSTASSYYTERIYRMRIFDENGTLSKDFVPCIRISDNKPGMYDLRGSISNLTNTPFYISANANEFTWG